MIIPTVEQYKDAVSNVLLRRQIRGLQILYGCERSSATAKQLALKINPSNPAPITASGFIGRVGKRFSDHLGIIPQMYIDGKIKRPAYFTLVSGKYSRDVGWTMHTNLKNALEELNLVHRDHNEVLERLPTETQPFEDLNLYSEGKVVQVFVDRFERNQSARIKCIEHFGDKCYACDFDFGDIYGDVADGFVHVHHKTPLSEIGEEYKVDPIKDLVPLCANCHSVVHLSNPVMAVEELKRRINKSKI
jgi:5-methylcytosine-specific restriction enzyme A